MQQRIHKFRDVDLPAVVVVEGREGVEEFLRGGEGREEGGEGVQEGGEGEGLRGAWGEEGGCGGVLVCWSEGRECQLDRGDCEEGGRRGMRERDKGGERTEIGQHVDDVVARHVSVAVAV